ncbi:MAG: DUF58 domain-containing protein, partial [Ancalomicrobiaceae bacterium]|nr:DUF58 domain-containing protein [Ancalomicrobiaceae bacterium]
MIDKAGAELVKSARTLSAALPDVLVEAHRVAATVAAGWHGRRQSGPGETFWQFRPFMPGEAASRVDWRKSARDDHLQVREREWESAHTVWLWPDLSASMDYRSDLARVTKRDRAVVILLAVADLLARGGERVGLPGLMLPTPDRRALERVARALTRLPHGPILPAGQDFRRFQDLIVVGDFLDGIAAIAPTLIDIAAAGTRGHIVQVLDPAEETFPFVGRIEFRDPETGERILAGRAESWAAAYRAKFDAEREELKALARRLGWSYILHHTDRSAAEPLLALHARLAMPGHHALLPDAGDALLPEA